MLLMLSMVSAGTWSEDFEDATLIEPIVIGSWARSSGNPYADSWSLEADAHDDIFYMQLNDSPQYFNISFWADFEGTAGTETGAQFRFYEDASCSVDMDISIEKGWYAASGANIECPDGDLDYSSYPDDTWKFWTIMYDNRLSQNELNVSLDGVAVAWGSADGNVNCIGVQRVSGFAPDIDFDELYIDTELPGGGANATPETPTLRYPANASTFYDNASLTNITLQYNSTDSDVDEITYFVYVSNDSTTYELHYEGVSNESNLTESWSYGDVRYWYVIATDNDTNSSNSSVYEFNISTQAPEQPTLTSPTNGTDVPEGAVILDFNSTDPDGNSLTYYVYGANVSNVFELVYEGSAESVRWGRTDIGNWSYWYVIASDGNLNSTNSTISQFNVTAALEYTTSTVPEQSHVPEESVDMVDYGRGEVVVLIVLALLIINTVMTRRVRKDVKKMKRQQG